MTIRETYAAVTVSTEKPAYPEHLLTEAPAILYGKLLARLESILPELEDLMDDDENNRQGQNPGSSLPVEWPPPPEPRILITKEDYAVMRLGLSQLLGVEVENLSTFTELAEGSGD